MLHTHIYIHVCNNNNQIKGVNNLKRSEEEHGKSLRERAWEGLEGESKGVRGVITF